MTYLNMKKHKSLLDAILLLGLGLICFVAIAPTTIVMPNALQMTLLAIVIALFAGFLVFLWREKPEDERETQNQMLASRAAYAVGSIVLIAALLLQSIRHEVDPAVPIALLAMIATKIIMQRVKDNH